MKNFLFYTLMVLIFGLGAHFILRSGARLESDRPIVTRTVDDSSRIQAGSAVTVNQIREYLWKQLQDPLCILLLQIMVIAAATKVAGSLCMRLGQPAVIGEVIAGILLGPSLLGWVFPGFWSFLFPPSSMGALKMLGQIGVILFMFGVGMEVNIQHLRERAQTALIVSHASIIVPFFLGMLLSLFIYRAFAPPSISFISFALFIGVALSITAFPVLARIIEDRGMTGSPLASTAIACAAIDDVTAWSVLALVVAMVRTDGIGASSATIFMAVIFITAMLVLIKPQLKRLLGRLVDDRRLEAELVIGILVFVLASACFTEAIGMHTFLGAFLAGIVMPPAETFRGLLKKKLTTFSSTVLLPLFFAYTGLRTQIGLLNDWEGWLATAAIITVAIVGKLGTGMLAARWTGMSWPDSFSLGALMNTRGLMELIVLNIGFDLGILPARIFAIMILMAIVTTSMTGPLLSSVELMKRRRPAPAGHDE